MADKKYKIAILGATGNVGRLLLEILEERNFPYESIKMLASERSVGQTMTSPQGVDYTIELAEPDAFDGVDIVFASAGGAVSAAFAPEIVKRGGVLIDNSSHFRMDPEVPLVVPEVNADAIKQHKGIIANPNCSTAPLVLILNELNKANPIKRVVVSTYQSISGAGKAAIDEMTETTQQVLNGGTVVPKNIKQQIAFNLIPQIDVFMDNDYTKEEMKLINETKKILGLPELAVTCTAVRVPVYTSHSESVNIEFANPVDITEIKNTISNTESAELFDDPSQFKYPMPAQVAGKDPVYVGRVRLDESQANTVNMWIVSDNLRIGAALNAVRIGEALVNNLAKV